MCLILFAVDPRPGLRLVLAANRDEFLDRPAAPAALWPGAPEVVGGRDLRGGGSWLGARRGGRWAALTNFRDPATERPDAPSRGHLVADFLLGDLSPDAYLERLLPRADRFNGFNLLLGDADGVVWYGNRSGEPPRRVAPGVYGLSNAHLDTPWPKVVRGREGLARLLDGRLPDPGALLHLLRDTEPAADPHLPATGLPPELERALSAAWIRAPGYGTRASTILFVSKDGGVRLVERGYDAAGETATEADLSLTAPGRRDAR